MKETRTWILTVAVILGVIVPRASTAQEILLEGHVDVERDSPNVVITDTTSGSTFLIAARPSASFFGTYTNSNFGIRVNNVDVIRLTTAQRVGIGTVSPQEKLHVVGNILVNGSFIDDGSTLNVPDYVFDDGYQLMPLAELGAFVAREKHLPQVPNAEELADSGLDLGRFQMSLLEKVEELTLYLLQQNEQMRAQQERIYKLEEKLEALGTAR